MKKKLVITKENIGNHVNRQRTTKAYSTLMKVLRTTESLDVFFLTLRMLMQTPKTKKFAVTKYGRKSGQPIDGSYVVDPTSVDPYFYLVRELEGAKNREAIMAFLVEVMPKKGVHLVHVDGGLIAFEYKQVITYSDHQNTEYAIQIVAALVKSHSRFDQPIELKA